MNPGETCPVCGGTLEDAPHETGCVIGAALSAAWHKGWTAGFHEQPGEAVANPYHLPWEERA